VLATEIYLQVIGMQRFDLGTTIAVVLLVPSVAAFLLNYHFTKKSYALISGQAQSTLPQSRPARKWGFGVFCWLTALVMMSVIGVVIAKALVSVWMYDWTPSLKHFAFRIPGGTGVLWTSLWISVVVGVLGVAQTMLNGYVIEKKRPFFAQPLYHLSVIPAAVPGMVMGLGYILVFNTRFLRLDHLLYGKAALIGMRRARARSFRRAPRCRAGRTLPSAFAGNGTEGYAARTGRLFARPLPGRVTGLFRRRYSLNRAI
jgi:iron(III) transport system permease protein